MKDERLVAANCLTRDCFFRRLVARRLVTIKVREVQAGPLLFLFIPPTELLALTPGFAVRTSRGTVVEDAPVGGPGKAPSMTVGVAWLPLIRYIFSRLGIATAVDPRPACG